MKTVNQLGFYSSLVAFIAASGYSVAQIFQVAGVVKFPIDAVLIYGFSLGIAGPYVIAAVAARHSFSGKKHIWGDVAIAFAVMYAIYVNLNYVVQLSTVIPASNRGTLVGIKVLDQTPHSLFWDADALGYICMGVSTFFLGFGFERKRKWLRGFLFTNGLMVPVISYVYFYPNFSTGLLWIGSPWIITTLGSLLFLCLYFRSGIEKRLG